MRTKLLILGMTSIILSSCVFTDLGDTDQSHPLKAGYTAYQYTEENLLHFTDIISYARMFREYIRQTTIDDRDSVNAMYFANTKIVRGKDPMNLSDIYNLTVRDRSGSIDYVISVFSPNDSAWKVQAAVVSLADTMYYNLLINDVYTGKWTVAESSCSPKPQHFTDPSKEEETSGDTEESDDQLLPSTAFQATNSPLTIQWSAASAYPSFELSGSGTLESNATPKLKIAYHITEPLMVLTYPAYETMQQDCHCYDYVSNLTAFTAGSLLLTANDAIDKTTDKYTVTLQEQHLKIFMGYTKDQYYRK